MSSSDVEDLRKLLEVTLDKTYSNNTSVIRILNKIKQKEKIHENELFESLKSILSLSERDLELFVIEDKEGILDIYSRYVRKDKRLMGEVALSN